MMDRYMSRATSNPTNPVAAKQPAAPVNSPATTQKGQAFADRLEKLEQRSTSKAPAKGKKEPKTGNTQAAAQSSDSARPDSARTQGQQGRISQNARGRKDAMPLDEAMNASMLSGEPVAAPLLRGGPLQIQPVVAAADIPPAHIERMASAIQELHAIGSTAEFQLKLPFGSTQIESVILGRDPQGRINIQLQSAAILPPQVIAQMSGALSQRLRQKDLRVGDVKFTSQKVQEKPSK
jgi:hypothetical protein